MLFAAPRLYVHINISLISPCLVRHLCTDVNAALDLAICSPGLRRLVRGWCMSDELSLSDHRYIMYQIETSELYIRGRSDKYLAYK